MNKNKMKKWEKIVIVLGLILIVFLILSLRKIIIIKQLQNKVLPYINSENYYARCRTYQGDSFIDSKTYKLGKEYLMDTQIYTRKNGVRSLINYCNGLKRNIYIDNGNEKVAKLESNSVPQGIQIINTLQTNNLWNLISASIKCSIKSEKCNGIDCYRIEGFYSMNLLYGKGKTVIYIDKETGLPVRLLNGTATGENGETRNIVTDYIYIFGEVTKNEVKEPDITEYKVEQI